METVAVVIASANVASHIGKPAKELADDFVVGLGYHLWDGKLTVTLTPLQNHLQISHRQMSRRQFNGNGNLFSGNRRQINTLAQERFQLGKDSRNHAGQEMVELIQTF